LWLPLVGAIRAGRTASDGVRIVPTVGLKILF
jgi:hypothetical protein